MTVRFQHDKKSNSIYFITFTCYKWRNLFTITNTYDSVYKWFDVLYKKKCFVLGYVIMPNHLHVLLYFEQMPGLLNTVIGNAKRFMAYEIIKRLEADRNFELLEDLSQSVKKREKKKGQRHKVFAESFDAKECFSEDIVYQKLNYIHKNPVSKKWNLVNDFTDYPHSSAAFYEKGVRNYALLLHVNEVLK
jgi:REP element-mobilizing transposase RayT